eukprot:Skav220030  [mRNA]  locus=scaffold2981:126722:126934:+ [translate_table: standard]
MHQTQVTYYKSPHHLVHTNADQFLKSQPQSTVSTVSAEPLEPMASSEKLEPMAPAKPLEPMDSQPLETTD